MSAGLKAGLQASYPGLSPLDKKTADYFLANMAQLGNTSMTTIASECGISKPAIVRLCKKLGFQGYKGFLQALSAEQALEKDRAGEKRQESLQGLDTPGVCRLLTLLAVDVLKDVHKTLDIAQMIRAVDLLMNSKRVIVYGWGPSLINVMDAQMKFSRIGCNVSSAIDEYSRNVLVDKLLPRDVVLMLPCPDDNLGVMRVLERVQARDGKVIIITTRPIDCLLRPNDVLIITPLKGHLPKYGDDDHSLAVNVVMTILSLALGERRKDTKDGD